MTDNLPISGEEFEALLLRLNEEEFVERIVVVNRGFKCSRGMTHGHRSENHILAFEYCNHIIRVEGALSFA